jgi:hypothetical protein
MIPRFKHILIPVDLTPKNMSALEIAVENRDRVSLLHVTGKIELADEQPDAETAAFYEKLRLRFMTELEAMSQRFSEAGVDVETKVSRRLYVFAHNNLRLILALQTGAVTDMYVYLWAGAYSWASRFRISSSSREHTTLT